MCVHSPHSCSWHWIIRITFAVKSMENSFHGQKVDTESCLGFYIIALPMIESGMKGLRVIKTTQSGFEHFIHDEYATLPDTHERVFSTVVYAKWHYASTVNIDFDKAW
jgi:urate oxidase